MNALRLAIRPAMRALSATALAVLVVCLSADVALAAPKKIAWNEFAPAAFRRAQSQDRPILLVLEVPWSKDCARARDELWNDPALAEIVASRYVPVRARADLRPDLVRRYPAQGWPAISILLPDGSPLLYTPARGGTPRRMTARFMPADRLGALLAEAARYYTEQREQVIALAKERESAARKAARPLAGRGDEALARTLGYRLAATYDEGRSIFGGAPRLPRFHLIEFMLALGAEESPDYLERGLLALETTSSQLIDEDGGARRMALGLDWEGIQSEKLTDHNARTLELLALAYRITGRRDYREQGRRVAGFLIEKLGNDDGSFAAAIAPSCPEGRDATVLSGATGRASAALVLAGLAFGDSALTERGLEGSRFLLEHRYRPRRGVPRALVDGHAVPPSRGLHLADLAGAGWAFVTAYQATGDAAWLDAAEDLARTTLRTLRDGELGALRDIGALPSGPTPLRRALYPIDANADFARVLVRLYYLRPAAAKRYQDAARALLDAFAESHDRVPLRTPAYALALYEFHFAPLAVVVVGRSDDAGAAALHAAALATHHPFVVVRRMDPKRDRGEIEAAGMELAGEQPTLFAFYDGLASAPQRRADGVRAAAYDLRLERLAQREAAKTKKRKDQRPEAARQRALEQEN